MFEYFDLILQKNLKIIYKIISEKNIKNNNFFVSIIKKLQIFHKSFVSFHIIIVLLIFYKILKRFTRYNVLAFLKKKK